MFTQTQIWPAVRDDNEVVGFEDLRRFFVYLMIRGENVGAKAIGVRIAAVTRMFF